MLTLLLALAACRPDPVAEPAAAAPPGARAEGTVEIAPPGPGQAAAVFAGGCFWCMEKPFDQVEGVLATTSGYTGGERAGVTYKQIGTGLTGHYEAIHVLYDPARVTYGELLEVFWRNIDPTQGDGQFCDRGPQYRSAVFTDDPAERALAEASREAAQQALGQPVVTELLPAAPFWVAEDYHQDFYKKNPDHYQRYRLGCGRDRRLEQLWGATPH